MWQAKEPCCRCPWPGQPPCTSLHATPQGQRENARLAPDQQRHPHNNGQGHSFENTMGTSALHYGWCYGCSQALGDENRFTMPTMHDALQHTIPPQTKKSAFDVHQAQATQCTRWPSQQAECSKLEHARGAQALQGLSQGGTKRTHINLH